MNKISIIIISLLLVSFSKLDTVVGQQVTTPILVSSEKVNINGDFFYVHRVIKKQTLYSISKAYNVSIESIFEHNPSTRDGLKAGTIIYIPTSNVPKKSIVGMPIISASKPTEAPKERSTESRNSEKEVKEVKEEKGKKRKRYRRHTVKWYETIVDIADFYGVSVEAIIHLNKLEANSVLKKRQRIFIPDKRYQIPSDTTIDKEPEGQEEKRTQEIITDPYRDDDAIKIDESLYSHRDRTYKISLILPFNASLSTYKASTNQMDFYSGVLMAIKDLQTKLGKFEYKLNVVDLSSYPSVSQMLRSGIIDDSELIIGPIIQKDLEIVAKYAKNNRIPIVSPMDVRTENLLSDNPYLFLFPSLPKSSQDNIVKEFIKTDPLDSTRMTIIFEKDSKDSIMVTSVRENFDKHSIIHNAFSYRILEGRGIDTVMCYVLDSINHNKVYIASESEAFVSDVLRNLSLLQTVDTFSISVYGPGRWRNFETLEPEYLHMLNVRFSLPYYVDYRNYITTSFIKRYWEVFNAEPSAYSFQGYDIAMFFLSYLNVFGRSFPAYLPKESTKLLQCDVLFKPVSRRSGFRNVASRNIIYLKDWEIGSW